MLVAATQLRPTEESCDAENRFFQAHVLNDMKKLDYYITRWVLQQEQYCTGNILIVVYLRRENGNDKNWQWDDCSHKVKYIILHCSRVQI